MGTETQVSITRQDPAIEAYRLGLLADTQGYIKQEIAKGTLPPDFQIANLSPQQQQAISMASQGVGAYQPYLQAGTQTLGQGIGATGAGIDQLGNALQTTGAGQGFINQAAQQAAATRDTPYAYQAAANQGLAQATQLGTGLGLEGVQSIQQGTQTGQQLGAAALQDISSLGGNAQQVAGAGSQNILNAASSAVPSTQYAQGQLANLGAGAQNIAANTAAGAGALQAPLGANLGAATQNAFQQANAGQSGTQAAADNARAASAAAQQQLGQAGQFGLNTAQQGIAGLAGSAGQFDPSQISPYMNSYEDSAVQQALQDVARQGQIQGQTLAANAVGAGAFGGARQGIAASELGRNVLQQQAQTAAAMRNQGYQQAAQQAQSAYESSMGRQQAASQLTGQLGQAGAGTLASAAQQCR